MTLCIVCFYKGVNVIILEQNPKGLFLDENLKEYDLSVLRRENAWTVRGDDNTVFYLNVCGAAADKCGADGAACFIKGTEL